MRSRHTSAAPSAFDRSAETVGEAASRPGHVMASPPKGTRASACASPMIRAVSTFTVTVRTSPSSLLESPLAMFGGANIDESEGQSVLTGEDVDDGAGFCRRLHGDVAPVHEPAARAESEMLILIEQAKCAGLRDVRRTDGDKTLIRRLTSDPDSETDSAADAAHRDAGGRFEARAHGLRDDELERTVSSCLADLPVSVARVVTAGCPRSSELAHSVRCEVQRCEADQGITQPLRKMRGETAVGAVTLHSTIDDVHEPHERCLPIGRRAYHTGLVGPAAVTTRPRTPRRACDEKSAAGRSGGRSHSWP